MHVISSTQEAANKQPSCFWFQHLCYFCIACSSGSKWLVKRSGNSHFFPACWKDVGLPFWYRNPLQCPKGHWDSVGPHITRGRFQYFLFKGTKTSLVDWLRTNVLKFFINVTSVGSLSIYLPSELNIIWLLSDVVSNQHLNHSSFQQRDKSPSLQSFDIEPGRIAQTLMLLQMNTASFVLPFNHRKVASPVI